MTTIIFTLKAAQENIIFFNYLDHKQFFTRRQRSPTR